MKGQKSQVGRNILAYNRTGRKMQMQKGLQIGVQNTISFSQIGARQKKTSINRPKVLNDEIIKSNNDMDAKIEMHKNKRVPVACSTLKYLGVAIASSIATLITATFLDRYKSTEPANIETIVKERTVDIVSERIVADMQGTTKVKIGEPAIQSAKITADIIVLQQPIPILMYHKISQEKEERFYVPVTKFEEQLQCLQKKGFHTITLSEMLAGRIPENAIALTFDDISLSFYTRVFPLMKKYKMKATAFVVTNDVSISGKPGVLNWKMLKEMEESGLIDIESHTMNHLNLRKQSAAKVREELLYSKMILEAVLGKEKKFIAWPYGEFSHETIKIARDVGYKGLVSTDGRAVKSRILKLSNIGRIDIDNLAKMEKFDSFLDGFRISKKQGKVFRISSWKCTSSSPR